MRLKPLAFTVLILAALAGLTWYLQRPAPPPSADPRIGQPLVGRATIEKTAQLKLSDAGKTVQLARQPDGSWRVASYYDLPAEFSKISEFVGNLTTAKVQRLVTSNPERIARLEFKDTSVELLDSAGRELWSMTLGKAPELGGGRFVRFGNEPKAYLADFSAWIDSEAKNWADSQLLDLKPDNIQKVEIPFADGGPVTVSRVKKESVWTSDKTPAGDRVKAEKISSLLESIGNVRFTETDELTDPKVAAARDHLRTFKLTTFDGREVTVALGRKPEEKKLKPPPPEKKPEAPVAAPKPGEPAPVAAPEKAGEAAKPAEAGVKPAEKKPAAPEYETIPAGPVFVFITDSNASAAVNALMKKRAFQISDYIFTELPQKPAELFETAPAPPAPPATAATPEKKSEEAPAAAAPAGK